MDEVICSRKELLPTFVRGRAVKGADGRSAFSQSSRDEVRRCRSVGCLAPLARRERLELDGDRRRPDQVSS